MLLQKYLLVSLPIAGPTCSKTAMPKPGHLLL